MVSPKDRPYVEAIFGTFDDLQRWQDRGALVEQPESGSQLAGDDEIFPWHLISQLVRLSLLASGEHLRIARDALKAGQLYPSAHFTSLRGAFVGAAQAVWVLSPEERAPRQQRALTVMAEMYRQLSLYYDDLAKTNLSVAEAALLTDQQAWLIERRTQVDGLLTSRGGLKLTTDVIPAALDHTFQDGKQREAGRRLWREMSSDAHILGWSLFQRSEFAPADRRTGMAEGTAGGSLPHVAEVWMASHSLLKEGWSLYDRRCEAP